MIPSAVLFDCDGVVVDSEGVAFSLLGQELGAAGLVLDRAEMEHLFLGGTVAGLYAKARDLGADLPQTWVEGFYQRLYAKLRLGGRSGAGNHPGSDAVAGDGRAHSHRVQRVG